MPYDDEPEPDTATYTIKCNVDLVITVHADVGASDTKLAELAEEYLDSDSSIYQANINGEIDVQDIEVD